MNEIYEVHFNKDYLEYVNPRSKNIDNLLSDSMMIVSGDFYGIQKFIFENISAKNASKVLRAKSAFIQIFTSYLAKYLCYKLNISEECILNDNAGKFEILSSKRDVNILDEIQKLVDEYFIENFYGLSGINICGLDCVKDDFKSKHKYKLLRENITKKLEDKKYKKFNLHQQKNTVLNYDLNINNQTLCKVCNIRKITKNNCSICNSFIELGKLLVKEDCAKVSSKQLGINIDNFVTNFVLDKKLKSYVLKVEDGTPSSFEILAKNSCKDLKTGIKSLGILKADVDNMGIFLKNSDITDNFENFDVFSQSLDGFFSLFIPEMMGKKFKDTYTVFAGGDDLFLIGAWDEIIELARYIQKEFKNFVNNKLSISFGIAIAKPSYPVSHLAEHTELLLEEAKSIDNKKDAITLFGETVKWDNYITTFNKLNEEFNSLKLDDIKTAFLYRLLDLVEMGKRVKYESSIEDTIWKSKLNYSFYRNMDQKYEPLLKVLNEEIEKNPKETKMFLCEYIYKRRES